MRLFVILALFTFFVGKFFVHVDDFSIGGGTNPVYAKTTTVIRSKPLRYLAIGGVYLFLVSFVVMYAVLVGLSA